MYWQIKISDYNMLVKFTLCTLLMSVASKTKTKKYTTAFLGMMVALSALPTWANASPGSTPIAAVDQPVVSTQATNQDLSVLRSKLKERFSWVAQEVTSLVRWTTSIPESFHGSADRTSSINLWTWVKPASIRQDFFVDIGDDPYVSYIKRLGAYGVLSSSQKFYPQNYFRVDDFFGVVKKIAAKQWLSLPADILSLSTEDGIMTKRLLQQTMMALKVNDIQIDGNPYDKLIRSEWAYYLVRMFQLPAIEITDTSAVSLPDAFTDISVHPFAYAINTLASLNILTTQNTKFYPDNYLRHYDFIILFVNALLSAKASTPYDVSVSSFADVESTATYVSQLTYAADRWLIDELITSKRGQLYFQPDVFMTKSQVYAILARATGLQFPATTTNEKMTRGELAQLLVESFWFEPQVDEPESSVVEDDATLINKLKVLLSML